MILSPASSLALLVRWEEDDEDDVVDECVFDAGDDAGGAMIDRCETDGDRDTIGDTVDFEFELEPDPALEPVAVAVTVVPAAARHSSYSMRLF